MKGKRLEDKKINNNIAFIIILIVIIVFIIFLLNCLGSQSAIPESEISKEEQQEEQQQQELQQEIQKQQQEIQEQQQKKEEVANTKDFYTLGESYEGSFKVTLLDYNSNFTDVDNYSDLKSTDRIIRAEFEIENVSREESDNIYCSNYNFTCFADEYAVENLTLNEFNGVYDSNFSTNLTKGRKIKGAVYFVVPKTATDVYIEYETTEGYNYKYIKFKVE
jgi:hypothetical protein